MKLACRTRNNRGLTLFELVVVVFILAVLVAMLLPVLVPASHREPMQITCVNNLKEISIAYRIWEGDYGDLYPTGVSVTNGGAMEWAATGDPTLVFQVMSNELSTPKILVCPEDMQHTAATNFFPDFSRKNISYFDGLDTTNDSPPTRLVCGDDNFFVDGVPIKSGLLKLSPNSSVAWASGRHSDNSRDHFWWPARTRGLGNVALSDGTVFQQTDRDLTNALAHTGLTTNRLAIP